MLLPSRLGDAIKAVVVRHPGSPMIGHGPSPSLLVASAAREGADENEESEKEDGRIQIGLADQAGTRPDGAD